MPAGTTKVSAFGYVAQVDKDGNVVGAGSSSASGPQPAASSQSVTPDSSGTPFPVVGNVASGVTDSGNPVKIGILAKGAVASPVANGQRANVAGNIYGMPYVTPLFDSAGALGQDGRGESAFTVWFSESGNGRIPYVAGFYYNGTTYDRARGDTTGAYVVSKGSTGVNTNQVNVGTTATQIVPARSGRGSVKITNLGTTDVFIGAAGVTTTTGDLLLGSKGASVIVPTSAALFGIVGTGTQSLSFIEIF